ncbi:MAG: hypothetical protein A3C43_08855 [Candidatus Schekmanbacteria bacterium RIFCSPHIGHO2_02_FULL_38_11]|uniref:Uncharacterized protein n=1 Tax=Candidatus Schekmanbacteria bacterium RIFCSPLOWO2_12_FULL_38_15 TaxID=1817883 RepID=A0A1F7SL95_9BACT|nr:MAG: hypothetical protein A2043_09145 [Candidatus Schekmanbacteria bacterium GWA2_38_9]OGL47965.1 MAG: hypothetical protein A3H37_08020 [Candidatus Schekmanbacteria bacterium RIFCSPLOWO2_02_FULL_38_14]OGL49018.1 MAG: hypothetical protein A3C43_08855 [Candidatus Schekmanbacteria bacterium RIFCSPHIGHO2_02_FULL_38_11]OGL54550.1 MAG: hypothetical protein A3G31_10370 [Candidatus Schekmanbacteria bacterium RIFCSPLOWO2_12_FULL_38_15]
MFTLERKRHYKKYLIVILTALMFVSASSVKADVFEVISASLFFSDDENKFTVKGNIDIGSIDLTANDVVFEVGSYNETIDAGSFAKSGNRYLYEGEPDDSGIKKIVIDLKAKTFSINASGADISGTRNPVEISIMVGDSFYECASVNMKEKETEEVEIWSFNGKSEKCDNSSDFDDVTEVQSETRTIDTIPTTTTTTSVAITTTTTTSTTTFPAEKKEKTKKRTCLFF